MTSPIEVRAIGDALQEPSLAAELGREYLIWDAFVAGVRRVDVQPLVLSRDMHEAAVRTAEGVVRVIGRVAARAHDDAGERRLYRLSDDVNRLAAASREGGDNASLMRVDLLLGEDGAWHACEVNADCPGGHNESLGLPRVARTAGFLGGRNPTLMVDALARRLTQLATSDDGTRGAVGLLYATAYAEDLQVCAIVQRALTRMGTKAILAPPTAPRWSGGKDGELWIGDEPVRALYRYFPAEYMEGQKNLRGLEEAIRSRRVRTLTSFAHIYTQSKYAFARAWHLEGAVLDDADRALTAAHVPASFDLAEVPAETLRGEREAWVVKRAFGRVGDEVFVGALFSAGDWAAVVLACEGLRAKGESWIAQRFVRQRPIPTPWGDRFVTLGAYVLDGQFVGYFSRITPESHVSHDALCVPVFTEAA